jgi:hypothetical protein
MSTTANSDWQIRTVFSGIEGFKNTCFSEASKGFTGAVMQIPGNPPIAAVRLFTRWKPGKIAAEQAVWDLVAKHEAGIP